MKIFAAFFGLIAAVLMAAAPARAADVFPSSKDGPAYVVPSSQEQSWSAIWGAALVGYSMTNTKLGLDYLAETESGAEWRDLGRVDGFGGEGWEGSLQIGGDLEIRGIVAGLIAEYSFGGTESSVSIFDGLGRLNVEQQDSYCFLGRLGVARGNTLFYGASGYCHTEFDATVKLGDDFSAKASYEFDGVPLELGVEHRFTQNIRGRLAGRYTWYGEETVLGGEDDGARLTAEPGAFTVKAGVVISTGGLLGSLER